jgi:hypothetical protein
VGGEDVVAVSCFADPERWLLGLGDRDGEGHGRGGEEPLAPVGGVDDVGAAMTACSAPALNLAVMTGLFGPAVAGGWSACLTSADPSLGRKLVVFDAGSYSVAALVGPALPGLAYAHGQHAGTR